MAAEIRRLIDVCQVPNFDRAIDAARDKRLAVWAEFHSEDRAGMSAQQDRFERFVCTGNIQNEHEAVPGATGQPAAVASELK